MNVCITPFLGSELSLTRTESQLVDAYPDTQAREVFVQYTWRARGTVVRSKKDQKSKQIELPC